jgi:hypothetical protein
MRLRVLTFAVAAFSTGSVVAQALAPASGPPAVAGSYGSMLAGKGTYLEFSQ